MPHLNNELFTPPFVGGASGKASPSSQVLALMVEPAVRNSSGIEGSQRDRTKLARAFYSDRRDRDALFPSGIFADPAWDILLILYSAEVAQQRLNITSVCAAAAVPATTALRWIDNLLRHGLLRKEPHATDGRTNWLQLTADARGRLDRFFDGVLAPPAAPSSTVSKAA